MIHKKIIVTAIAALSLLGASAVLAANKTALTGHVKTGMMSVDEVKKMKNSKLLKSAANQLYVCNETQLPSQTGTTIQVSFPGTGVADQFPVVNQCAYISTDSGTFSTEGKIIAPQNSGNVIYDSTMNGGQMWGVTYDSSKNAYAVGELQ